MSLSPPENSSPDFDNITKEDLAASICQSIQNDDKNTLKQLLERCENASLTLPLDHRRSSALHLAASRPQYKECLELLLEYSGTLFGIDDGQKTRTAFYVACKHGCEENVSLLLQKGCDPYKISSRKRSALFQAVRHKHTKIVQFLLDHYPDNINQSDKYRRSPLFIAMRFDQMEVGRMLLEKGANVRAIGPRGNLPLHEACMHRILNVGMIRTLVEYDSTTINHQNSDGVTPIMLISKYNPDIQAFRFLHESGADLGICDNEGRLALHYAANSGNTELLQYVLQHTETRCIEHCFMNIPNVLQARHVIHSLTGCAIQSRNVECLKLLLSSNKLSKSILQTPMFGIGLFLRVIYSPLALAPTTVCIKQEEEETSFLHLLIQHKITMLDEFFRELKMEWPFSWIEFQHPFSNIFNNNRLEIQTPLSNIVEENMPFSKQQHYFYWLNENNINLDYCLQSYCDNTQPFATFTDYYKYYIPLLVAMHKKKIEAVKLMMSNSAIIEPDELLIQFDAELKKGRLRHHRLPPLHNAEEIEKNISKYLINLKPIYYRQVQLCDKAGCDDLSWYPYLTTSEEFSQSTLQQLCRTTIRQHIRKYTLEDNLRDFRRNIWELPLPTSLKDYLLFKS